MRRVPGREVLRDERPSFSDDDAESGCVELERAAVGAIESVAMFDDRTSKDGIWM